VSDGVSSGTVIKIFKISITQYDKLVHDGRFEPLVQIYWNGIKNKNLHS
jgi:hypothetical protein